MSLNAINTATKYPSIPTLHVLGPDGRLTDECIPIPDAPIFATEKIDGTNARVITHGAGEGFIGSRNDLLWAAGDQLHNPAEGICGVLRPLFDGLDDWAPGDFTDHDIIVYGEVFGANIGGRAKLYGSDRRFRVFDVAVWDDLRHLSGDAAEISARRERGALPMKWLTRDEAGDVPGCEWVPSVPFAPASWSRGDVLTELRAIRNRWPGAGRPEGVVLRTADRSWIAKCRIDDYEKSLRATGQ